MFFLEMTIGPAWAVPMDIGGRIFRHGFRNDEHGRPNRRRAFAHRVRVSGGRGSWVAPFGVSAGLLFIGAAIWAFWIDPEKSVIDRDEGMKGPSVGILPTPVASVNR